MTYESTLKDNETTTYKNGNGFWKTAATFLIGIVMAGAPLFLVAYDNPSRQEYENLVEEIQNAKIERAILQQQLNSTIQQNTKEIEHLKERIDLFFEKNNP